VKFDSVGVSGHRRTAFAAISSFGVKAEETIQTRGKIVAAQVTRSTA
jgi:hypothetical protein